MEINTKLSSLTECILPIQLDFGAVCVHFRYHLLSFFLSQTLF